MKILIIGPCGSGKSYIARQLSQKYGIPYYELDNLVWDRSEESLKYPVEVRDSMLDDIVKEDSWIVEGVHYKWGHMSFERADYIFVLKPNRLARELRVIGRFVKTRLGIEQWNYKQSVRNLYQMIFEWNRGYDREAMPKVLELTDAFKGKRVIVKRNEQILEYLERHRSASK